MTQKTHNLPIMVVLLALVVGLAIYINMVAHPDKEPGLTIVIVILFCHRMRIREMVCNQSSWYDMVLTHARI